MLTAKEKIVAFLIAIAVVILINGIHECYITKDYTISYTEVISNVQKNIDENIVEIKDKVITRGSVLLLAEMKNGTMNLYHLERGYLTLRYKVHISEDIKRINSFDIENRFEKFRCKMDKYNRIIINPATFTSNINWDNVIPLCLTPLITMYQIVICFMERRKEKYDDL